MGKSEAVTSAYTFQPEAKSAHQHEAELDELMARARRPLDQIGITRFEGPELVRYQPAPKRKPARKVWRGTVTELAVKVDSENRASKKPLSTKAACERACERYERPDGRRFSPHSLQELLGRRRDLLQGHR